jgi:hypothetical protein
MIEQNLFLTAEDAEEETPRTAKALSLGFKP